VNGLLDGARKQVVVVEYHDGDCWVMLNDGSVQVVGTPDAALSLVQKMAKRGNRSATITTVEWRNMPDGFVPPKG
jgi:hypothetical protein